MRMSGGRLQVRGPVTDEVRDLIRRNRDELVAILTPRPGLLGSGLSPELQAQRWGPSLGHDLPGICIDRSDPVALAKALEWADQADPYATAERQAIRADIDPRAGRRPDDRRTESNRQSPASYGGP